MSEMNLTCSMLALWPIVVLWSFRASVGQIKRGTDNWSSAPQAGYDPSTRFHQRSPVYNLKHEVKTSSRAIPLQSGLGSKWTVLQNWSPPRTKTLSTSSSRMKIPALASRFEKGANSRPYVPKVWSSPRPNLYQRRFYSPRRRSKITATVLGPAKTNGYRHNIYQYWNHPSLGPHQRPDQTPKREVQKTRFPFQLQYMLESMVMLAEIPTRNWPMMQLTIHQSGTVKQPLLSISSFVLPEIASERQVRHLLARMVSGKDKNFVNTGSLLNPDFLFHFMVPQQ